MRLAGHRVCIGEIGKAYGILIGKPDGRRHI
jgi:hypothetical protein